MKRLVSAALVVALLAACNTSVQKPDTSEVSALLADSGATWNYLTHTISIPTNHKATVFAKAGSQSLEPNVQYVPLGSAFEVNLGAIHNPSMVQVTVSPSSFLSSFSCVWSNNNSTVTCSSNTGVVAGKTYTVTVKERVSTAVLWSAVTPISTASFTVQTSSQ